MRERFAIWPAIVALVVVYCGLYLAARASHLLIERCDARNLGSERGYVMTRSIYKGYRWEWDPKWAHHLANACYVLFRPLCELERAIRDVVDNLNEADDLTDNVAESPDM